MRKSLSLVLVLLLSACGQPLPTLTQDQAPPPANPQDLAAPGSLPTVRPVVIEPWSGAIIQSVSNHCQENVKTVIVAFNISMAFSGFGSLFANSDLEIRRFCDCIFTKVSSAKVVSSYDYVLFSSHEQRGKHVGSVGGLDGCDVAPAAGGLSLTYSGFGPYVY